MTQRKIKALAEVQLKTDADIEGLEEGECIAYPAVFDVKDSHGDIIRKGAFAEDLDAWRAKGDAVPVLYGHDFWNILHNIGGSKDLLEDDHGLRVKIRFDMESETGQHAYRMVKQRRIADLSFAYDVLEEKIVRTADGEFDYNELIKLKLYEVSFVPIGANRETSVVAVKNQARTIASAAGRVQAAKSTEETTKALTALVAATAKAFTTIAEALDPESLAGLQALADESTQTPDAGPDGQQPGEENHDAHTSGDGTVSEDPSGKDQGDADLDVSAKAMDAMFQFHALRAESETSNG
ncbi:HK97 family phage prohead protease [Nesterenkonia jeotgali]|uniref:Prohead serine protease domain-containing protein n=1 Tax=Nesterenkonia jeotgali TaxID=317018 RepID=A0A0W8ICU1_9MICC|nr:HK97 family phage prohead protease [Nesterenkonia jeotgali]KUG57782.1 hypothetical protein AVL63_04465 [Nesterenkonia jeotgali]